MPLKGQQNHKATFRKPHNPQVGPCRGIYWMVKTGKTKIPKAAVRCHRHQGETGWFSLMSFA